MAERSKALDWNSSNILTGVPGFESLSLRQNSKAPLRGFFVFDERTQMAETLNNRVCLLILLSAGSQCMVGVGPGGSRLWRFKYRYPPHTPDNKEKLLALGSYPEISLQEARDQRDSARSDLAKGIDPGIRRAAEKEAKADTFRAIAAELIAILRKASTNPDETSFAEEIEPEIPKGRKQRKRKPWADTMWSTARPRSVGLPSAKPRPGNSSSWFTRSRSSPMRKPGCGSSPLDLSPPTSGGSMKAAND